MYMKPVLSDKYIKPRYTGLDIYKALKKVTEDFPEIGEKQIEISYSESSHQSFRVIDCGYDGRKNVIQLIVSSSNPIRHLPSNYQNNTFLRGFLMIFQHIMNKTSITLNNMHEYFRPMEAPCGFLPILADWLGIHLDTLGSESEVRKFLQYAIPLYQYRGTTIGLRAHLAIVTGIVPDIIEGERPYSAMIIEDSAEVETSLFESKGDESFFTILFPVDRGEFSDSLVQRLSLIVQREKPMHTKAYIGFMQPKRESRKVTVISEDMASERDGIIFI